MIMLSNRGCVHLKLEKLAVRLVFCSPAILVDAKKKEKVNLMVCDFGNDR